MKNTEDSSRVVRDDKIQNVVLKGGLEDMLWKVVWAQGIKEFQAWGTTFEIIQEWKISKYNDSEELLTPSSVNCCFNLMYDFDINYIFMMLKKFY